MQESCTHVLTNRFSHVISHELLDDVVDLNLYLFLSLTLARISNVTLAVVFSSVA
jgi:hypothetical protein